MDKILHLDAGRKYFSGGSILQIIKAMKGLGYTQLQLAFGNDGLRFLLDDMSMEGKSSEEVKEAVYEGNRDFNQDPSCLTEGEMETILSCAAECSVEVVPLLNLPGHMNTVLYICPQARWVSQGMTSMNSLAVTEEGAVSFGLALLKKYVTYFAQKGCRYFCFGGDEYANDIYSKGGLGFNRLLEEGHFSAFTDFLNKAAAIIKDAGMIPRAFNDGFYYHEDTTMEIDPSIQVCYWGKGWIGFWCASVDTIAAKGHELINCHGAWYYVLMHDGRIQRPSKHPEFLKFSAEMFPANQPFSDPAGVIFCVWCDEANLKAEEDVVADILFEMEKMAGQLHF